MALWMVLALAPRLAADLGRPIIQTYMPADLGGGRSWSMVQDGDGSFYFGCDALVRFDGEHWTKYPVPGSYTVRGIAPTPDRVYVGAINEIGYFDRVPGGLSAYHSLLPYLPADQRDIGDVWEVLSHGSDIIFASSTALYVWDGRSLQVLPKPGSRRLIAFAVGGKILVAHRPTGLWQLQAGQLQPLLTNDELGGITRWVGQDSRSWVIVTDRGIRRYDGRTVTPFGGNATDFIRANVVVCGAFTRAGELVLGTLASGVAILDREGNLRRHIEPADGFPSQVVVAVVIGRDGALWTASPAAIARLALDEGISFFNAKLGLEARDIYELRESGHQILATSDNGLFSLDTRQPGQGRFEQIPGLRGNWSGLSVGPDGLVLVGGFKKVYAINGPALRSVADVPTVVGAMLQSRRTPGILFFSSDSDVVEDELVPGGAARPVGSVHLPDVAESIAEDTSGHLWIGTRTRGAFSFPLPLPAGGVGPRSAKPTAASGPAVVVQLGPDVAVFRPSGIELYAQPDAAPQVVSAAPATNPIAVSNSDPTGKVWAVYESPFGDGPLAPLLGCLCASAGSPPHWLPYAVPGLAQVGRIDTLQVDRRGILWLGGMNGIMRVDTNGLAVAGAPEAPRLEANVRPGEVLPAERNDMHFDFAAPEFGRRESIRYQTRFTGDPHWTPPRNDPHLSLAGLRDGHYTFQVRTISDTGAASPAASLSFVVLPRWYHTLPAMLGFLGLASAGVFGGFRWRLAYLRRQNALLESLVQKKTEQLEKANEAKSEFLANMSHEIRNPISGILGMSLAFGETELTPQQQQLAESINTCAALLATLVDDVLDFAKIEAGSVDLRAAPFTLRVLLDQAVSMVGVAAREADCTIRLNLDPRLPAQLVGDVARLQQILLNYLTNALKFGRGRPVEIGASAGLHDRIRFFVRDAGPGMTPAESAKLFTKFSRLESARANNIRGTGLGLAVCRLIATRMGGQVGVDSWPGEGSCFWAEIPLARATATPFARPEANAALPLKALVVDDIDYNIVAMQAILRRLGIPSDAVGDGPGALAHLQASFYDVAFLDWNLPGMNGNEVATRFRAAEPPGRRTFIIATTAHTSDMTREMCLKAGMDAFIPKPITPDKIADALHELGAAVRTAPKVETRVETEPALAPEVDMAMLRFLGAETPEGVAGQAQRFLGTFDADRRLAHEAVAAGDPEEMRRIAHRLLSHCSIVKYAPLTQLASDLQRIAAFAPPADLARLLVRFDQEFTTFRYKLESSLASTAPA